MHKVLMKPYYTADTVYSTTILKSAYLVVTEDCSTLQTIYAHLAMSSNPAFTAYNSE